MAFTSLLESLNYLHSFHYQKQSNFYEQFSPSLTVWTRVEPLKWKKKKSSTYFDSLVEYRWHVYHIVDSPSHKTNVDGFTHPLVQNKLPPLMHDKHIPKNICSNLVYEVSAFFFLTNAISTYSFAVLFFLFFFP